MSLLLMFAISWLTAIVTISFYILLYKYIDHIEPEVNWGSAHQAQAYYAAASQMSKLQHIKKHIKTWRPSYLILGKAAEAKKQLFTLATQLRKGYGFVFVGDIQIGDIRTVIKQGNYYPPNGSSSSSSSSPSLHPAAGASTAASPSNAGRAIASNGDISMSVIGPQEFGIDITPAPARRTRAESYSVSTNNYSHWHAGHMGSTGSAFSCPVDEHSSSTAGQAGSDAKDSTFDIFTMVREANMFAEVERIVAPSFGDGMLTLLQTAGTAALRPNTTLFPFPYCPSVRPAGELEVLYEAMRNCVLLRYGIGMLHGSVENRPRKPDGTIDVWWLADTGGLILLLAHLLREHDSWKGCEIRVFVNQSKNGPKDMKPMVTLLKKFRIKITHVENINLNAVPFSSSGTYLEEDASFGGYRRDADANNNDKFARNGSRLSDLFSRVETHDSIATSPLHGSSSSIEKKATASQDKLLGYELSNLNLADMQESSDIQRMDSGDSSYSFSRKASEDAAQMTLSIHNNPALSAAPSSSVSASASASGAPQTIHEHVKNSASAGAESAESAKSLDPASSGDEIECKLSDPASHNLLTPNVSHPELADEDSALMSPDKSPSQVCHTLGAQETKSGEELAKERRRRDKKKLQHYLRVGQCVRRRSKNAEMIFVTLPGPSRKRTPDTYFSWLEAIVRPVDVLKRLKNSKGEKALEKQQKMKEEQEQENSGETKKSSQSNEEKKNNNVRFQGHDENNDSNTTSTTTTTTADVNDNQDTNTNADADATSDNLDSHLCYGPKADTDMPPIILVRGSQENVLSYYS